ncbi:ESX secretion-associated protein EspG [Williamsia sp. M5A3_1d]
MTVIGVDTPHEFMGDEILVLCAALGIQTLPSVLRIEGHDVDFPATDLPGARERLLESEVIDDAGNVSPDVRIALESAVAPDWSVQIRRIDATQMLRGCLVGVGERRFLVTRNGRRVTTREVLAGDDVALVQMQIGMLIGEAPGADIRELQHPSDELDRDLATCVTEDDHAELFFRRGLDVTDARALASALMACNGQTQIIANDDVPAARTVVAVFDTHRGRIVSSATPSVTGERWTTIAPGDPHRVAAALRQLAHTLPGGV